MKTKAHFGSYVVLGFVILAFVGFSVLVPGLKQFATAGYVRTFILGFGGFAFAIYMALVIASVLLPIPSTAVIVAGGYVFGTTLGMILAWVSMIVGSSIAFFLIRWSGRPLLEKMVDAHHLKHFNAVFNRFGATAVLISYAIPLFPSDSVSLFLGLTRVSYSTFLFFVVVGHIPRLFIISSLGADFYTGFTVRSILLSLAALAFVFIVAYREKIHHMMVGGSKKGESKSNKKR